MGLIEGNRYQFTHDELCVEGRPFASADADRILVKHTGKDDVGWNLVESLPESKVEVGKCDMHIYTKSICCTTWSCLAVTMRPRFMI